VCWGRVNGGMWGGWMVDGRLIHSGDRKIGGVDWDGVLPARASGGLCSQLAT